MTENRRFKQRVRARAAKTGESYTAALQHFRTAPAQVGQPAERRLRIAAAQIPSPTDPGATAAIRQAGAMIRELMDDAKRHGVTLIHFAEGTLYTPDKRLMSRDRDTVTDSDWSKFDWDSQSRELRLIAEHAATLGMWAVIGAVHRLISPRRPHNSLYVIDDRGQLTTRYDERMLSFTKQSHMYSSGTRAVTFGVDGVRFGCALGMESVYPEVFLEYEQTDVDCILFSSHGANPTFGLQVQGHASTNSLWISYATSCTGTAAGTPSGIAGIDGSWIASCAASSEPAIAVADINIDVENPARSWRRTARANQRKI